MMRFSEFCASTDDKLSESIQAPDMTNLARPSVLIALSRFQALHAHLTQAKPSPEIEALASMLSAATAIASIAIALQMNDRNIMMSARRILS
jgi:hypothetical protein